MENLKTKIMMISGREFVKREKESGYLKGRAKVFEHDFYFLIEKYAREHFQDKVQHLDLNSHNKSYIQGANDALMKLESWIKDYQADLLQKKKVYSARKRPLKKVLYALEEVVSNLYDVRLMVLSCRKENYRKLDKLFKD